MPGSVCRVFSAGIDPTEPASVKVWFPTLRLSREYHSPPSQRKKTINIARTPKNAQGFAPMMCSFVDKGPVELAVFPRTVPCGVATSTSRGWQSPLRGRAPAFEAPKASGLSHTPRALTFKARTLQQQEEGSVSIEKCGVGKVSSLAARNRTICGGHRLLQSYCTLKVGPGGVRQPR